MRRERWIGRTEFHPTRRPRRPSVSGRYRHHGDLACRHIGLAARVVTQRDNGTVALERDVMIASRGNCHDIAQCGENVGLAGRNSTPRDDRAVPAFPAATATTVISLAGILVWPQELSPNATTVPSLLSAT